MEVRFGNQQLRRCFERSAEAARRWGPDVGRRYIQRVSALHAADHFNDLFTIRAFRLHPLGGNREGQYALTLIGRWRLIIRLEGETITVEEVSNHYGD